MCQASQKFFIAPIQHPPDSPDAETRLERHASGAGPPAKSSVTNLLTVAESLSQEPL
jgi:hypothetical protein